MSLTKELTDRGFINQFSGESLEAVLDGDTKRTVYLGIDPTADAIHVGNLVPYMLLNHLMRAGHNVILLMGGGTALIGDPSGKDSEREFVDAKVVKERAQKMEANIRKLAINGKVTFVNNYDWLSKLLMVEFLRDVGKHFTVNAMMKKESVARRLESEQGISFTEFSYALLQGYDFYHLYVHHGCTLQIGGSDQWGNIISGVDYIRRVAGEEVYGLTMPLIVDKATGKKFGKSEGNAVWLNPEKTSPYAFYQFWLNTPDESVIDYLKLFTLLPLDEIAAIEAEFRASPETRSAQKKLADEVTTFVHGEKEQQASEKVSRLLFEGTGTDLDNVEQEMLFANAPGIQVDDVTTLSTLLVESGLATSMREAKTFIESGAIELNGVRIEKDVTVDPKQSTKSYAVLKRGKKNVCILKYTPL